jgi:hypothetical protein
VKRLLPLVLLLGAGCPHRGAAPAPSSVAAPAEAASQGGAPAAPPPAAPQAPTASDAPRPDAPPPPESAPAPAPPARRGARADLRAIRAGAEAVLRAQAVAYWRWFSRGDVPDPGAAWKGQAGLLSDATLAGVAAAARTANGDERRGLAHLHAWLVGERLARDAAEPARGGAAPPAPATFQWDGRAVPLRDATALLAGDHDHDRRRALAEAAAAASAPLVAVAEAREARLREAAKELGYGSTLELAAQVRGEVPDALGALAEAVLTRTEASWNALLDELARREGLARDEIRASDLPWLLRTTAPAAAFPGDRQLDAAAALLGGIGLDLSKQHNLHLDPAARAGKIPHAIAIPLDPPGDVRLSTAPVAGLDALRGVLHELGVAEHYAHVRPGPPELRRLGPAAIPEAWGILFEEVGGDPAWLAERGLDVEHAKAEARTAAARRLLRAREAAARVLAAIARARAPAESASEDARLLARAHGCPADRDPFPPLEPDPLLRSAEALRAELLAAQAELFLEAKAGAAWWRSPASGGWLRGAWAEGGRRTAEEVSLAMGQQGLDPAALEVLVKRRGWPDRE